MGILIPKFDKRKFKHTFLANSIQAVLIEDTNSKSGSVAISVASGSNNDPPELPGLAHLLEHMLFLGSSRYPDHTEMEHLAAIGGGYSNAYTSQEETNYYFVSGNKEFEQVTDMFSWFFKDPLLIPEGIEKEVQNVDSEHRKNLNDDNWKAMELIKLQADEGTNFRIFHTGNQDTLWNIPKGNGVDMSDVLRTFYKRHYSANLMKLVIVANRTLDDLEEMANKQFTNVTNTFKIETKCEFPYKNAKFPYEIRFLPTKEKHIMTLVYPLNFDVHKNYLSQPLKYISMLIEYGGKTSLSQQLKDLGLIQDMDLGFNSYNCWAFFEIEFTLTDKGLKEYLYVVQSLEVWMTYIRNVYSSSGIWNMMQKISESDFYYMHSSPRTSDSLAFASNVHKFPFKYIYTADNVFFKKDDPIVFKVLNQIVFNNTLVMLASPKMTQEGEEMYTEFDKEEQYYGAKYTVLGYTDQQIKDISKPRTKNGKLFNERTLDSIDLEQFNIPSSNPYVPQNLDMVCPDRWFIVRINPKYINECSDESFEADGKSIEAQLLTSDKKSEMWFKQDRSFFIPVAKINIRFETDKGNTDIAQGTKLYFFESLLGEWIVDNLYDALQMSYNFGFEATHNGIEMSIYGYSDKITNLTKEVLHTFRNLKITQKKFDQVKDKFVTELQAQKMTKPYILAYSYTKVLYDEHPITFDEILKVAQSLHLSDVQEFHDHLFDQVYTKSLVHGNMMAEEAIELKADIDTILNAGQLENPAQVTEKMHILDKPHVFTYHLFNANEDDSAIMNTYQVAYVRKDNLDDLKNLLFLEITSSLISNYAYDYLRTERLLGYIVSCSGMSQGRSAFLYVLIQGNKAGPAEMDNEIERMLRAFRDEELAQLTSEDFEGLKQSIEEQLGKPDKSLVERNSRIWREIVDRDRDFHVRDKLLKQLFKVELAEFVNFFTTKLAPEDTSTLKKLSVQFYSPKTHPELPSQFPDAMTPYGEANKMNKELVQADF